MGPTDLVVVETGSTSELAKQPFAESAMWHSMYSDLLPELSGEMWVAAIHLDEATSDLPLPGSEPDLITSSITDKTLTIAREWVRAGAPPTWSDCAGLFPELCSWPHVFGFHAFDNREPVVRVLPGEFPNSVRVLVLDATATLVGFLDDLIDNMSNTPDYHVKLVTARDLTSLRRRWPSSLFVEMHRRQADMEPLCRVCKWSLIVYLVAVAPGLAPTAGLMRFPTCPVAL